MELPPSSDYTDMGRMSESPKRNYPNNTVAIVARPGLRPAPTSTGTVRRTIPSYNGHTHTQLRIPPPCFPDTLPLHPDHPMNKNEIPKMDVEKERGRERVGAEGSKTKCLGQDQPGISPYVVPTHRLGPEPSSVSPLGMHPLSVLRPDHTATQ